MSTQKPELLAPAGNLEKLRTAFSFGADAVYIGTPTFGLRKFADNFSLEEINTGVIEARAQNKAVYVVLNGFAHDSDIDALRPLISELNHIQPHGFIISDLGVMALAKELSTVPIHISTQASASNVHACEYYRKLGAKRVILGREVSLEEVAHIKKNSSIEIEIFIHGAMCASYSGKCTISNYSSGRDSNRGGCVQSCRHEYEMFDDNHNPVSKAHIMNAKDLNASNYIQECIDLKIDSLKIEGRMKSNMYLANAVESYRTLIDAPNTDPETTSLKQASNRLFSEGAFDGRMEGSSIHYHFDNYAKQREILGIVKEVIPNKALVIQVKFPFKPGEKIEFQTPGKMIIHEVNQIFSVTETPLEVAKTSTIVQLPFIADITPQSILRKAL